jgi:hypothetical protein
MTLTRKVCSGIQKQKPGKRISKISSLPFVLLRGGSKISD